MVHRAAGFEVDSTESIWYTLVSGGIQLEAVLKLTPQSQYGISANVPKTFEFTF